MVVALGTGHGQAKPCRGRDIDAIEDDDVALLLLDRSALAVEQVATVESSGDALIERVVGQQVAGELLDREPVERQVGVQGPNHPIPPNVLVIIAILLEAVAVGVAGGVEPGQRHALAVVGAGEEAGDDLVIGVRGVVREEVLHVARAGGQAGQVQEEPAEERGPLGLRRGIDAVAFQPGQHKAIDRVADPGLVPHGG